MHPVIIWTAIIGLMSAGLWPWAVRRELANTRPRPRLEPLRLADEIPLDVPIPGLKLPRKRRVPPGAGALTAARTGPLAWIWEPLPLTQYPWRSAADGRLLWMP